MVSEAEGFTYPLKIVFVVRNAIATVVTAYPLKKVKRDEGPL